MNENSDAKTSETVGTVSTEEIKLFGTRNGETMERFYTVSEAAVRMQVKPGWVYKLIREGRLESVLLPPRRRQVPESAIKKYIAEHPQPWLLAVRKVPRARNRALAREKMQARSHCAMTD